MADLPIDETEMATLATYKGAIEACKLVGAYEEAENLKKQLRAKIVEFSAA